MLLEQIFQGIMCVFFNWWYTTLVKLSVKALWIPISMSVRSNWGKALSPFRILTNELLFSLWSGELKYLTMVSWHTRSGATITQTHFNYRLQRSQRRQDIDKIWTRKASRLSLCLASVHYHPGKDKDNKNDIMKVANPLSLIVNPPCRSQ